MRPATMFYDSLLLTLAYKSADTFIARGSAAINNYADLIMVYNGLCLAGIAIDLLVWHYYRISVNGALEYFVRVIVAKMERDDIRISCQAHVECICEGREIAAVIIAYVPT